MGAGRAALLIHGVGAPSSVFDELIERAKGSFRLITPDLPSGGHAGGPSRLHADALADELALLLDELGVRKAAVLGHSYGGVVAIELAARHPERLAGLIVASAPALGLPSEVRQLLANPVGEWAARLATRLPTFPGAVRKTLQLLYGNPAALTPALSDAYVAALRAEGFYSGLLEALRFIGRYRIPVEGLKLEGIPRVVLWGERDRLVPVIQGEQVARALGAELKVLEGAGHCLPEERPEALLEALASVLPGKPRAGGRRPRGE